MIQLEFEARPSAGKIAVTYATEGTLTLTSAKSVDLMIDSTGKVRDTVIVRAPSEGVFFANVFATIDGRTQAVSIPVQIGDAALKLTPNAKAASPAGAPAVIEIPATETVR